MAAVPSGIQASRDGAALPLQYEQSGENINRKQEERRKKENTPMAQDASRSRAPNCLSRIVTAVHGIPI
jgi:hypothetical protein